MIFLPMASLAFNSTFMILQVSNLENIISIISAMTNKFRVVTYEIATKKNGQNTIQIPM
jgi:sulfopyruvate decarboxylase TPP-binding subunit